MTKLKRFKNKNLLDAKIETFCQSVEEVLTKIYDRCELKKAKKQRKKSR
jgi:hypothetical protein